MNISKRTTPKFRKPKKRLSETNEAYLSRVRKAHYFWKNSQAEKGIQIRNMTPEQKAQLRAKIQEILTRRQKK